MPDICEVLDRWDGMSETERFGALSEWLADTAMAWGISSLSIHYASSPVEPPPGEPADGAYLPGTNELYLDPVLFEDGADDVADDEDDVLGGFPDWAPTTPRAVRVAAHELWHAYQDAILERMGLEVSEADRAAFEEEVLAFLELYHGEVLDECSGTLPATVESASPAERARRQMGTGDWVVPDSEAPYA